MAHSCWRKHTHSHTHKHTSTHMRTRAPAASPVSVSFANANDTTLPNGFPSKEKVFYHLARTVGPGTPGLLGKTFNQYQSRWSLAFAGRADAPIEHYYNTIIVACFACYPLARMLSERMLKPWGKPINRTPQHARAFDVWWSLHSKAALLFERALMKTVISQASLRERCSLHPCHALWKQKFINWLPLRALKFTNWY